MMGDSKRTSKNCAGLTIFLLTVAEEKAVRSRIAMAKSTSLTHINAGEGGAVFHCRAILNDKVITDDTVADMDGCLAAAVQSAILQSSSTFHLRIRAHVHIFNITSIYDGTVMTDDTSHGSLFLCALCCKLLQTVDEEGTMPVESFEIRLVSR